MQKCGDCGQNYLRRTSRHRCLAGGSKQGQRSHVMTGAKQQRLFDQAPLKWWRTFPAEEFDRSRVTILRTTLSTIAILEEPTWRSPAGGSAAAAIGMALRLNPDRSTSTAYDLSVTAL